LVRKYFEHVQSYSEKIEILGENISFGDPVNPGEIVWECKQKSHFYKNYKAIFGIIMSVLYVLVFVILVYYLKKAGNII